MQWKKEKNRDGQKGIAENLREKLEKRLSASLKINRVSEKMCPTKMRVEDELRTFHGASES